jgi:transposase
MKQAPEEWIALSRLAESLGNICEACRRLGVSRHFYYAGIRKWGEPGASAGSKPRKRHPHSVPAAREREILALAAANPDWGGDRIAYYLKLKGVPVSAPTVLKILVRNGLRRPRRADPPP